MAAEKDKKQRLDISQVLARCVMGCFVIVAIGGGVLVYGQVERYLMRDNRFYLERAAEYGDPPPNLTLDGLRHANREKILKIFEEDLGRSVYLLPLDKRRAQLMANVWVKDATISRLWPNQVSVQISERKPVAFVKRAGGMDTTVIDSEGVLMDAPPAAIFSLPVVAGVGPEVEKSARALRMHRVDRLIKDLGEHIEDAGEIDAADSENLRVVQAFRGRAVTLILGNRNFKMRYENFLAMSGQLMERLPNAVSFDLRLEEQVTAAEERKPEPKPRPFIEEPKPAEHEEPAPKPAVKKSRRKRGQ